MSLNATLSPFSAPSLSAVPGRLFAWGSGKAFNGSAGVPGAEKIGDKQGHIPFPRRVSFSLLVRQVVADTGGIFGALDKDGNVWGWGATGKAMGRVPGEPTKIPVDSADVNGNGQPVKFAVLACGEDFLLALEVQDQDKGGRLFAWNLPQSQSQTGGGAQPETFSLSPVPEFEGKKVLDISAGGCVAMAVVEDVKELETNTPTVSVPVTVRSLYMRCTKNPSVSRENNGCMDVYGSYCKGKFVAVPELAGKSITRIAVGSIVRACVDSENKLYCWGNNRNGCLGLGFRGAAPSSKNSVENVEIPVPTPVPLPENFPPIVSIDCTRGQPRPKNENMGDGTGQEGPRIHLVTADGGLWIAGTCHKGLGANHVGKIMTSANDHLSFYRVGGAAADVKLNLRSSTSATGRPESRVSSAGTQPGTGLPSLEGICPTGCIDAVPSQELAMVLKKVSCGPGGEPDSTQEISSSLSAASRLAFQNCGVLPTGGDIAKPISKPADTSESKSSNITADDADSDAAKTTGSTKSESTVTGPICTSYLRHAPIISTCVGHIHSLALSADGRVFAWGCGSDGRLGVPHFFKRDGSKRLMKCYVSTPSRVGDPAENDEFRTRGVVRAISCGRYWNFAIVET